MVNMDTDKLLERFITALQIVLSGLVFVLGPLKAHDIAGENGVALYCIGLMSMWILKFAQEMNCWYEE